MKRTGYESPQSDRYINLIVSSKTSHLGGIIRVEYVIPKKGSHSTDKKSVGKGGGGGAVHVRVGMHLYNNN